MDDDDDGNEDDDQEGHVAPPGGDRWSCAPDPCQIKTQVMPHTATHTSVTLAHFLADFSHTSLAHIGTCLSGTVY